MYINSSYVISANRRDMHIFARRELYATVWIVELLGSNTTQILAYLLIRFISLFFKQFPIFLAETRNVINLVVFYCTFTSSKIWVPLSIIFDVWWLNFQRLFILALLTCVHSQSLPPNSPLCLVAPACAFLCPWCQVLTSKTSCDYNHHSNPNLSFTRCSFQ